MIGEFLITLLSRAFVKDPQQTLALRLQYPAGTLQWTILSGTLTTVVTGGIGANLTVDLSTMSVRQLTALLAAQPGYAVPYVSKDPSTTLSALTLLDGQGDQADSNGDHLYAYTNALYAYMGAAEAELDLAQSAIQAMPAEMSVGTADGVWLDFLGGYYGVPRLLGETDAPYGLRILAETLLPKGNNVAIEMAIEAQTGQPVTVVDVREYGAGEPSFDGGINFDGTYYYNNNDSVRYNLFDVTTSIDLINGQPATVIDVTTTLVNKLRDAGNFLRTITLIGGVISDQKTGPHDLPVTISISKSQYYDGSHLMDGSLDFSGVLVSQDVTA